MAGRHSAATGCRVALRSPALPPPRSKTPFATHPVPYSAQLPEAGKYESLHPVVGIHLVDFVLHKEKPHFLKVYRPVDVLDPNQDSESVLSQDEIAVILELPLMDRGKDCGRLEKLLQLLESEGGDQAMVDSLVEQDKIFAEIDEAYRKFTADPELRYIYEARLKARLDRNSMMGEARDDGLAEGEETGIEKGKVETARNLKRIGVAIDTIVQATGLTKEVVEGL